jgi:hypothetical protein
MSSPIIVPVFHWTNVSGVSSAGYKLNTYFAGTNNPQTTWTDSTLAVANANPVILDAAGDANVWIGSGVYKFVLTDASNNVIWTADQVSQSGVSQLSGTALSAIIAGVGVNLVTATTYTLGSGSPWATTSTAGDDYSEYSLGSMTVRNAGRYLLNVDANILINGATITSPGSIQAYVNGLAVGAVNWYSLGTGGTTLTASLSAMLILNANDVVTVRTTNQTTFSAGTPQSANSALSLVRVR